jgi:hypothetical protein
VLLLRWRLYQDMPVLFRDKSAGSLHQWNVEAPVREGGVSELQEVLDRLAAEIEDGFALLDADDDTVPGDRATLFGPPDDRLLPEPGGSVFDRPQNQWLRPRRPYWPGSTLDDC